MSLNQRNQPVDLFLDPSLHPAPLRLWHTVVLPCVAAAAYVALALGVLATGHLHEDAYILYTYAEHLAQGHGIAYYAGGEPAEGATDFLWMMALAALRMAGVDVAIGAALLNGLGIGLLCLVLLRYAAWPSFPLASGVLGAGLTALVIVSPLTVASLAGFSTALYCAAALVAFHVYFAAPPAGGRWLPWLALLLGLIRPDGVILGAGFCLLGLLDRRGAERRRFLVHAGAAALVGAVYFAWRWRYFGQVLPLPLLVKSSAENALPGLLDNLRWLRHGWILVCFALLALPLLSRDRHRYLAAFLPALLLLAALSFAKQSQNFFGRFQGPAMAAAMAGFAVFLNRFLVESPRGLRLALALAVPLGCAGSFAWDSVKGVGYLRNDDYINYLPFLLRPAVPSDACIALTEAGRLAHWLDGTKVDLVGLNTPHTAVHKVDPTYLEDLSPDLLFVHTSGTLQPWTDRSEPFFTVSSADLTARVTDPRPWREVDEPTRRAPLVVYHFLASTPDPYTVIMARYSGPPVGYHHLFAVKNTGRIDPDAFVDRLAASFRPEARRSYLAMKHALRTDASASGP